MHHALKTWPSYFEPVWDGRKTFEVRVDDRGFQAGDTVSLREWDPSYDGSYRSEEARYTGRVIEARIGYVLSTAPDVTLTGCVFSLLDIKRISHD